ncbi:hypothetical protein CEXT_269101 [Caerostris extrusa]|uniref:Uncharacterized protein n=1 Tax=Caerostris extrusa TaxID=172846 RepID=A0AAV4R5X8_CAEEX|nr:hypothetical protein CEXT_269101 [Caerostris extrusa]
MPLYESVISESVDIFEDSLNHVVNNLIDGLFTEMQLAALAFRKSTSFFLPPVFQAGPPDGRVILAEDIPSGGRSISSDLKGYEDEQDVPESLRNRPQKSMMILKVKILKNHHQRTREGF